MTNERLNDARWVLERQLAWIAAADVKVGVVVAIQVAMVGGLGAAFSAAATKNSWIIGSSGSYAFSAVIAMIYAAMTLYPRIRGPNSSLLLFGRIAGMSVVDYTEAFKKVTEDELLEDWTIQIHRNAEIACDKHDRVGKAMMISFLGGIPWVVAVSMLVMPK